MISPGCMIRVLPSLRVYDGITLARWYLREEEDEMARDLLVEAKRTVHQALNAELMNEKYAQRITAGIDDTIAALANKDYEKAEESVKNPLGEAINHALQQVVKCEVFEPLRKHLEMRKRLDKAFGDEGEE